MAFCGSFKRLNHHMANASSAPAMASLLTFVLPSKVTYGVDYPDFQFD